MSNHYLSFATILLPRPGTDLSRYSVIACDQFTSQPDYWQKVRDYVGNTPSTLGMILPEIYLAQPDAKERIQRIHRTMERYQAEGVFVPLRHAMVCVRRTLSDGSLRRGIVGLIDLEQYDYRPGSDSLIRATEQTVLERLPPRMEIRQGAPLELPHVMLLVDDEQEPLIQPICDEYQQMEPLYDFDLMLGSGHLSGYRLDDASAQRLTAGLEKLADPEVFSKRYGISGRTPCCLRWETATTLWRRPGLAGSGSSTPCPLNRQPPIPPGTLWRRCAAFTIPAYSSEPSTGWCLT